jgi:Smr domain
VPAGGKRSRVMKLVNLEAGMPSVPLALSALNHAMRAARSEGFMIIKVIHGYGSSGEGGSIRSAVQAELSRRVAGAEVQAFIAGEDWRISDERAWSVLQRYTQLKADSDLGRGNRGISIVVL